MGRSAWGFGLGCLVVLACSNESNLARVTGDGAELLVPEGEATTGLVVTKADAPFEDSLFAPVGPGYRCGPAGRVFGQKVTLRVPIDPGLLATASGSVEDVRVYTRSEGQERFEPLATRVDANRLTAEVEVSHFSDFQVGLAAPNLCMGRGDLRDCMEFVCLLPSFIEEQPIDNDKEDLKRVATGACGLTQCIGASENDPSCSVRGLDAIPRALEELAHLSVELLASLTAGNMTPYTYHEILELLHEAQSALQRIPLIDPTGTWVGTLPVAGENRPITLQLHRRANGTLMGYVLGGTHAWTVAGGWVNGDRMRVVLEFNADGTAKTFTVDGTVKFKLREGVFDCGDQFCSVTDLAYDDEFRYEYFYLVGTIDDGASLTNVMWNRTWDAIDERRFSFFVGDNDWWDVAVAVEDGSTLISGNFAARSCQGIPCAGSIVGMVENPDTGDLQLLWKSFEHETGWLDVSFATNEPPDPLLDPTQDPRYYLYTGQWQMTAVEGAQSGELPGGPLFGVRAMRTSSKHAGKTLDLYGQLADDLTGRMNFLAKVTNPPYTPIATSYKHFGKTADDLLVQLATEVHTYDPVAVEFSHFRNLSTIDSTIDLSTIQDSRTLALGDALGVEFHDRRVGVVNGIESVYRDVESSLPTDEYAFLSVAGSGDDVVLRLSGNQLEANAFRLPLSDSAIDRIGNGQGRIETPFGVHSSSHPGGSKAIGFAIAYDPANPEMSSAPAVLAACDSRVQLALGESLETCPVANEVAIWTQCIAPLNGSPPASSYTVNYSTVTGCEWEPALPMPQQVAKGTALSSMSLQEGFLTAYRLEFGVGQWPSTSYCPYWALGHEDRTRLLEAARTMAYPGQLTEPYLCNARQGETDVFPLTLTWTRTTYYNNQNPDRIRFVRESLGTDHNADYTYEVLDGSGDEVLQRGMVTGVQTESQREDGFRELTFTPIGTSGPGSGPFQGWFRTYPTSATSATMVLDFTGESPGNADSYGVAVESRPSECDDGNPCTMDLEPSPGNCVYAPGNGPCFSGNRCSTGDHCEAGACVVGTIDCDDDNVCTNDYCDPTSGCQHGPIDEGICDDGNPCTANETCTGGTCIGQPVDCSDNDLCNGTETCDGMTGDCVSGIPLTCDDGDPCNGVYHCVASSGCAEDIAPCYNNNACDGNETCDPADGICHTGTPLDCIDQDACTEDDCDPAFGCVHTVHYGPPDCEPVITLTHPPRGATLGSTNLPLAVQGTALDYTGQPLGTFLLRHNGQNIPVFPNPSDGSFTQALAPVHGLNTLVATKLDGDGHGAHAVQGYYWSDQWQMPDIATPTLSYVPSGMMARLGQDAWDDTDAVVDDVAALLGIAAGSAQFSDYFPEVSASGVSVGGCTWNISLSGITASGVSVDLDPQVQANLLTEEPEAAMYVRIQAEVLQATINLVPEPTQQAPCDVAQQTTVTLALDVTGWLTLSVTNGVWAASTDWPFGSAFVSPQAVVTGLQASPCSLGDVNVCTDSSANSALTSAFEGAVKDALSQQAPDVLESILNRDRWQTVNLQTLTPQLPSAEVTAWARPTSIEITSDQVTVGFDVTAVANRGTGVQPMDAEGTPFLGSILRGQGCAPGSGDVTITDAILARLQDDTLNRVLYTLWEAGGLHQTFTQARLVEMGGADPMRWGFTDLELDTAPMLPPIIHDCDEGGRLVAQVGDLRAHATGNFQGQVFEATVYFTASAALDLGMVTDAGGGTSVSVSTDQAPIFADFELVELSGNVPKNALRDALSQVVEDVPSLMGISRTYEFPTLNVTGVVGDYLGMTFVGAGDSDVILDIMPTALTRQAGYTLFSANGR